MNSQRSSFVSGMVLGIAFGLTLGHLTLWRSGPAGEPHSASIPAAKLTTAGVAFAHQVEDHSAALSAVNDLSLESDSRDQLPIHADWNSSPLINAIAIQTTDDRITAQSSSGQTSRGEQSTRRQEPQPLNVADATPLATHKPADEAIRALVESELSDLSPQQREVWYEALKDVDHQDVAGILRMWKQLGGPVPPGSAGPSADAFHTPQHTNPAPTPTVQDAETTRRNVLNAAIRVRQRNIEMAYSIGYLRRIPALVEQVDDQGRRLCDVTAQIDFNSVRTVSTSFPLDLAIVGPGLLQVRDEAENVFYTRTGRFCLGTGRRIVLMDGSRELHLSPEISIPEGVGEITVRRDGAVEVATSDARMTLGTIQLSLVLNPLDLLDGPNGLFRITPERAAHLLLTNPGSSGAGQIAQRMLETPAVDIAAEREAIEVLEQLKITP